MRVLVVGDVALDVLVAPAAEPVPGADVPARIRTRPGGAGANTAAWLAHLGRRGIAVTLAARVGADPAGRAAAADLAAAGVAAHLTVDPEAATCTVVGGARRRATGRCCPTGARQAGSAPDDLPDVAGFDHLHLSGYVLLDASSRAAGRAALAAARAAGLTTSVDPQAAPALAAPQRAADFLDDVRGVDLLLPNADELDALGGPAAVLRRVGAVAVSAGATGASWVDRSAPVERARARRHRGRRDRRGRRVRRGRARGVAGRGAARGRRSRPGARRARPRSAASARAPDAWVPRDRPV